MLNANGRIRLHRLNGGPLPFGTDFTVRALQIVNEAMKVQIHVFLTSATDACSASAPDSFNFLYPLVRWHGGNRRGLNSEEERVNSVSALILGFSSPWYSHCRDRPVC